MRYPYLRGILLMFLISFVLAALIAYSLRFYFLTAIKFPPTRYLMHLMVADWISLILTYPVTVLLFYFLVRRERNSIRVWGVLLSISVGALLGFTALTFLPPEFPISLYWLLIDQVPMLSGGSLGFLFVAVSGAAIALFSRTSSSDIPVQRRWSKLIPSAIVVFFFLGSSLENGLLILGRSSSMFIFGIYSTYYYFVIGLALQFMVFYILGKRYTISERPVKYFAVLFLGAYIGTIIGSVISVSLYGHSSWTISSGYGSLIVYNGIMYRNVPASLYLIINSLNPIGSLPFLAFSAMSIPGMRRALFQNEQKGSKPSVEYTG